MDINDKTMNIILKNIPYDKIISDKEISLIEEMDFNEDMSQIKNKIMKSVKKKSLYNKIMINGLAVSAIILISIIGFTPIGSKTLARIVDKFYFIPGLGKAEVNIEETIYILKEPYQYAKDHKEMVITSITQYQNTMVINMSGNYNKGASLFIEAEGTRYESGSSSAGYGNGFVGSYYFSISEPITSFNLLLSDDDIIPITLVEVEGYQEYATMGPTDVKKDFGITLVPRLRENIVYFDLFQHKDNQGMVANYGIVVDKEFNQSLNIHVQDDDGNDYPVEYRSPYAGVLSSFFFVASSDHIDQVDYTVQIPEITLKYDINKAIILPMPEEGENNVNQRIEMGDYDITITKIIRDNDSVTVYMDTDSNKQFEKISYAMLDMKEMSINYLKRNMNDDIILESMEFEIDPSKKKLKIVFQELYTVLKGPWEFHFNMKE